MARILIADDAPEIRRLLRMVLMLDGHEVVEAADGDEALALLRAHRPSVAVLDVSMPGRTGLDVCRAVRADAGLAGVGLVVASANGLPEDVELALSAGADRFVAKPFAPRRILEAVDALTSTPR